MRPSPRGALCFSILILLLTPSVHSASVLPSKGWEELTDRKLTETGTQALDVYGDAWRHAESAHFVYHFHDAKAAETVLVHAEAYYAWVKQMFGVKTDDQKRKGHVFIFEDREVWKSFNSRTPEKLPGAEAFTNGFELFIHLEPFYLEPQRALAHEITHLVVFRFVKEGPVPLFLNEGFAELMATKALALKAGGDDFSVKTFGKVAREEFIPVEELAAMKDYPTGREKTFYLESELLTRFLALNHPPAKYYEFMKATAGGKSFERALEEVYKMDIEAFSAKFEGYAVAG